MATPRIDRLDKNLIINGNFSFWQRGTSFNGSLYGADRWFGDSGIATSGFTQQSGGPSERSSYFARWTGTTGSVTLLQRVESAFLKHIPVGTKMSLSYWMKTTSGTPVSTLSIAYANVKDVFSAVTEVNTRSDTLSTSWQRFTYTFDLTSQMQSNGFRVRFGNASASGSVTFDLAEVMLVVGESPAQWSWSGRDAAEELMLCRRYYYRPNFDNTTSNYLRFAIGQVYSTTQFYAYIPLQVPLRATPTLSNATIGTLSVVHGGSSVTALTALAFDLSVGSDSVNLIGTVASGLTIGQGAQLTRNNNTTAWIALDAEL